MVKHGDRAKHARVKPGLSIPCYVTFTVRITPISTIFNVKIIPRKH